MSLKKDFIFDETSMRRTKTKRTYTSSEFVNSDKEYEKKKESNIKKKPNGKKKVVTIKKRIPIGSSKLYDNNISELYNLLDTITFNKVNVPVFMSKQLLFDDENANGNITIGSVNKFSQDEFTINVFENFADKISDKYVMFVRCFKNYTTGEFTYVDGLYVVEGKPLTSFNDELLNIFENS